MDARQPDLLKPTLISGLVFGLIAGLPIVSVLNLCCCAPAWGAGILATYLYAAKCKALGVRFGASEGTKVGFVSGVVFAITGTALVLLVFVLIGGPQQFLHQMEQASERLPIPGEAIEMVRRWVESGWFPVLIAIGYFGFFILSGGIFATLGGLLGGAIFKHEPAPPAPPMVPPPPPAPPAGWGGMPPSGP